MVVNTKSTVGQVGECVHQVVMATAAVHAGW